MKEEKQRVFDKITYETNGVLPTLFLLLLKAVKKNEPLNYEKGRDVIFPKVRAAHSNWDPNKKDTHASNMLEQYRLVDATEDRTISVSKLGYKFLDCFDQNDNLKVSEEFYKTVLLELIFAWHQTTNNYNIHPGRVLFKLLLDKELDYYITDTEFALWTQDKKVEADCDYDYIKSLILKYRKSPYAVNKAKAEVFVRAYANEGWKCLLTDRIVNNANHTKTYYFSINPKTIPLLKCYFIEAPTESLFNDQTYNNNYTLKTTEQTYTENQIRTGDNIIIYGIPGSGKSWIVNNEYCDSSTISKRIVFHPDYTNSDFIGQILPSVNDEDKTISYTFKTGPFTNILRDAIRNPQKNYVLIIEEINRGNAPAIFGDVFQLLDRLQEDKTINSITYPKGTSEYSIYNENISYAIYQDPNKEIRIPANLSLIATMNTADQNVFTLDTAFQRRWKMRLVSNSFEFVKKDFAKQPILDTGIYWQTFCENINDLILKTNDNMLTSEDKCIGVYFINKEDLVFDSNATPSDNYFSIKDEYNYLMHLKINKTISKQDKERLNNINKALLHNRLFPEKILKYLWDDAFKFNHDVIFNTKLYNNLEDLIHNFVFATNIDRFKIFNEDILNKFVNK